MLGPFERADLPARDAHPDIADSLRGAGPGPAGGVGEEGIAAVDDDVVRLEVWRELLDHVVHRPAGLDHDDDRARPREARDKVRQRAGGEEAALLSVLADKLVRPFRVPVEDRDAETLACGVPREIRAHDRQAQYADVSQIRHRSSPSWDCVLAGCVGRARGRRRSDVAG